MKKALEYHNKTLEIAKKIGDIDGEGRAYVNIGNIHRLLGNYEMAIWINGNATIKYWRLRRR